MGLYELPLKAIASISTGTPLGSSFTATHDRAGLCVKYFSYTLFISAKFSMEVRKTVTCSSDQQATHAIEIRAACLLSCNLTL